MPGRDMHDPQAFKISTVSGHSLVTINAILARYMVRTSKMATLAFQRRLDAEAVKAETVKGAAAQ